MRAALRPVHVRALSAPLSAGASTSSRALIVLGIAAPVVAPRCRMPVVAVTVACVRFCRCSASGCSTAGFGLSIVETREWGGLMLTLFLAIYAGLIAIPLGILLALGRRSRLPLIRFIVDRLHRVLARRADHHRHLPRLDAAAADPAVRLRHRSPGPRHHRPRLRDRGLYGGGRARRPAGAARGPGGGRARAWPRLLAHPPA